MNHISGNDRLDQFAPLLLDGAALNFWQLLRLGDVIKETRFQQHTLCVRIIRKITSTVEVHTTDRGYQRSNRIGGQGHHLFQVNIYIVSLRIQLQIREKLHRVVRVVYD